MKLRPRRVLGIGAALVGLCATVLVAAPGARAEVGDWGFGWRYDSETQLRIDGTLPGVNLTADIVDNAGHRHADQSIVLGDTDPNDGLCAKVVIWVHYPDQELNLMVCNEQEPLTASLAEFTSGVNIRLSRATPAGEELTYYYQYVPRSLNQVSLQFPGVHFWWQYAPDGIFWFSIKRQGMRLAGDGYINETGGRTLYFTLYHENPFPVTITGGLAGGTGPIINQGQSATIEKVRNFPNLQVVIFVKTLYPIPPSHYLEGEIPLRR